MERETAQKELEELEALVASEGWKRFLAHFEEEWGPVAYRQRVGQALSRVPRFNRDQQESDARDTVFQVEAAAREVERIVNWSAVRIKELRAVVEQKPPANPYARTHY